MAQQWSAAPAPTLKGKGAIITGIVLLLVGLVAVIAGIAGTASALSSLVSGFSSPKPTPAHFVMALEGGTTYAVYEESGGGTGANGDPFLVTVQAQDVTITGPSGTVPFIASGQQTQSYTTSGTTFVMAGSFDPQTSGSYTIDVSTSPVVNVVVAPSFTSFGRAAGWIGLIGLGALLGLAGLITLIVGLVRRSGSKKKVAAYAAYAAQPYAGQPYGTQPYETQQYGTQQHGTQQPVPGVTEPYAGTAAPAPVSAPAPVPAPAPPAPAALPPAGWYPDPAGGAPGAQRYWDGQAWTEHRA
jgi:hypothetical protein